MLGPLALGTPVPTNFIPYRASSSRGVSQLVLIAPAHPLCNASFKSARSGLTRKYHHRLLPSFGIDKAFLSVAEELAATVLNYPNAPPYCIRHDLKCESLLRLAFRFVAAVGSAVCLPRNMGWCWAADFSANRLKSCMHG